MLIIYSLTIWIDVSVINTNKIKEERKKKKKVYGLPYPDEIRPLGQLGFCSIGQ